MGPPLLGVRPAYDPIHRRLAAACALGPADAEVISRLHEGHARHRAGADIPPDRTGAPLAVTRGWAAYVRVLADGRRQILRFALPGDLMRQDPGRGPAAWSVTALTEVSTVRAAPLVEAAAADRSSGLGRALATAFRDEERQFLEQIVRLGRLTATERVASLMLELRDRLEVVGLGDARQFPCPLTQEMLADAMGLSAVHVNRVLKELRESGALVLRSGVAQITGPQALADLALRDEPVRQRPLAAG